MFTIFGASGNTGAVVARDLLDRGQSVRVVARDPAKVADLAARGAEVVRGDVLDAASVAAALDGARGAYLLLPPDLASDDLLARNRRIADVYRDALVAKRTPHAVLLSSIGAQVPSGTGPIAGAHYSEQALAGATGTTVTFLRAAFFAENILAYAHPMKNDGVLPVFGGGADFRFPIVATQDIGRTAAALLLAPPSASEVVELSGPVEASYDDAAAAASRILGRTVKTANVPIDAMVPTLTGLGFSANVAGLFREMTEASAKGIVRWEGKGRAVRGTTTIEDVLRAGLR